MTAETKRITLDWREAMSFTGGEPGGPSVTIDANNAEAPGPMLQVLMAAAACTSADIVHIFEKMRIPLRSLHVAAEGERAPSDPRRYVRIRFHYRLAGDGLDEAKARRAIDLSLEKYCSVIHSLRLDHPVEYALELG
jgi:putative redox protein